MQATLQDVRNKFRKFQNPSELEPRLERMLRVLRDLEQSMCYIELASDDCEAIEGQLNNCIVTIILPALACLQSSNIPTIGVVLFSHHCYSTALLCKS